MFANRRKARKVGLEEEDDGESNDIVSEPGKSRRIHSRTALITYVDSKLIVKSMQS